MMPILGGEGVGTCARAAFDGGFLVVINDMDHGAADNTGFVAEVDFMPDGGRAVAGGNNGGVVHEGNVFIFAEVMIVYDINAVRQTKLGDQGMGFTQPQSDLGRGHCIGDSFCDDVDGC